MGDPCTSECREDVSCLLDHCDDAIPGMYTKITTERGCPDRADESFWQAAIGMQFILQSLFVLSLHQQSSTLRNSSEGHRSLGFHLGEMQGCGFQLYLDLACPWTGEAEDVSLCSSIIASHSSCEVVVIVRPFILLQHLIEPLLAGCIKLKACRYTSDMEPEENIQITLRLEQKLPGFDNALKSIFPDTGEVYCQI